MISHAKSTTPAAKNLYHTIVIASIPARSSFNATGNIPHSIAAMRDRKNPVVCLIFGLCMNESATAASISHDTSRPIKILFREVTTGLLSDYLKAYYLTRGKISFLNDECKPYLARYLFDSEIGNRVDRLTLERNQDNCM